MARLSGSLPSYEEWRHYGGNHGPWFFLPIAENIVYAILALVILSVVTFITGVAIGLRSRVGRLAEFLKGFFLALLQIFWAYLIIRTMFWAID
jgi:hypothetical protein